MTPKALKECPNPECRPGRGIAMDFTGKGFRHSCAGCGTASAWANKETDASRIWNALPRANDCAELVEELAEILALLAKTMDAGASTPGIELSNRSLVKRGLVLIERDFPQAIAKYKEPVQ